MNIKHDPVFPIDKVIEHYSEKDGVPVQYVCTTDMFIDDMPADVFYRKTPHPQFGNKYFALYHDYHGRVMITNADKVEEFNFGMVENDSAELEYSQSRHDFKQFNNGNMIDGGRSYIRSSGNYSVYRVKDGEFVSNE